MPIAASIIMFAFAMRAAAASPLQDLLKPHPAWQTKSVTSHDFWGGNGDGHYFGGKDFNYKGQLYKAIFHERGEGLIQRLLLTARDEEIKRDFLELVVLIDGKEVYFGSLPDFFSGKGPWAFPLVHDQKQGSGAFISHVPFPYKSEALILVRSKPHFYQVTYREGHGASATLSPADLSAFMSAPWWQATKPSFDAQVANPKRPAQVATGPTLVTKLQVRLWTSAQLQHLKVQVGSQTPVPLAMFFGLGASGEELDHGVNGMPRPLESALYHVNPRGLLFTSRLPIPLRQGESLKIISATNQVVETAVETSPPVAGVRFEGQFRDQRGHGRQAALPLFESHQALKIVSTTLQINDGKAGDQSFLEGDEVIRVDGQDAPAMLGTGTKEYFGGGWHSWHVFSNFFSGMPRRLPISLTGNSWKARVLEHTLYRQHVIDPIVARNGARFGIEAGEHGAYAPVRYRSYVAAYVFEDLRPIDTFNVVPPATETLQTFVDGEREQNQKPRDLKVRVIPKGKSSFQISCPMGAVPKGVLLTRTYDGGRVDQFGEVFLNSRHAGTYFNGYANPSRRFAQDAIWLELEAGDCDAGSLTIDISVENWTEGGYTATFF